MSLDDFAPRRGLTGYTGASRATSAKPKKVVEELFAGLGDRQTPESENTGPLGLLEIARELMVAAAKFQAHYRINQRDSVLKCYRAALMLADDDKEWNRFCPLMQTKLEMQEKEVTRDKVLNLTFLYAYGKTDEDARKSASLFTRALRPSFKAKSPTSTVLALLDKHGGFKGLAQVNGRGKTDQGKSKHDAASVTELPVRRAAQLAAKVTGNSQSVTAKGPQRGRPLALTIAATLIGGGHELLRFKVGSKIELHGRVEGLDQNSVVITINDAIKT